jgi:hypothetical protein
LESIFNTLDAGKKKLVCQDLNSAIAHSIIAICGVASTNVDEGESVEHHKEFADKDAVRTLMTTLSRAENENAFVAYMDEVTFKLPEDVQGISGDLDLMCASYCSSTEDVITNVIMVSVQKENYFFKDPVFGETKKQTGVNLVGRDVYMSLDQNEIVNDINSVSQPVAQILSVAQMQGLTEPVVLFYSNRQVFRPFIYYKSADVLLTTKEAYRWFSDKHLDIHGVMLMAFLMRTTRHLTYVDGFAERLLKYSLEESTDSRKYVDKSGFVDALGDSNVYEKAFLKTTSFKSSKSHHSATPKKSMTDTQKATLDVIRNLF